jgi:hypothetical protein
MTVRAKVRLSAITELAWGGKVLRFECLYDPTIPEDQRFQVATPSGHIELQIDNPAAVGQFKNGESYYVDFNPVNTE